MTKPSPTAAAMLRVAIKEGWSYELFTDHHRDRFDDAQEAIAKYLNGQSTREQAEKLVFGLMLDTVLDYFGDDIPVEDKFNEAIIPNWLRRQAE